MEEQCGQALRGRGGLHDLLLRHPRLQLLAAKESLPHLQEEVPLRLPGESAAETEYTLREGHYLWLGIRVCVCVCVCVGVLMRGNKYLSKVFGR